MAREGKGSKAAMDLYTLIGLGGLGFYVTSYGLVQLGKMDGNGALYSVMNVLAASMAAVSLTKDFNLPSMVTQITWITVGVVGLLVRARRHFNNHADVAPTDSESDMVAPVGSQRSHAIVERMPDLALASTQPQAAKRVRPRQPATPRPQFNLRPDVAPGQPSPLSLGLRPDRAPVS